MSVRWFFISVFAALAVVAAVGGLARQERAHAPNVLLVTVEGMRADAISAETTPALWQRLPRAYYFTGHRAVSAWTASNIVSILTGVPPFEHGVHTRGNSVPPDVQTPLDDMADAGWRVGGLQPFMQVNLYQGLGLTVDPGRNLQRWMATHAAARDPFFLWHHYLDTHLPYAPSGPFMPDSSLRPAGEEAARRIKAVMRQGGIPAGSIQFQPADSAYVRSLYEGGFREFDAWFAELWEFLERGGLDENTIVILTADHGEEVLERGNVGHASTTGDGHLHEEIVRAPLIIWLPEHLQPPELPRTIDQMTSHIDIMPTVASLLGVEPARGFRGRNVLEPLPDRTWMGATSKAGFVEEDPGNVEEFRFAAVRGRWKLHLDLLSGEPTRWRLFDLEADPGERVDLALAHPEVVEELGVPLLARAQSMRPPHTPEVSSMTSAAAPEWVIPERDGVVRYDDLAGHFRLEWTGPEDGSYVIQYEIGEGDDMLAGELHAEGTVKDFGVISRRYWNTWLVPLGTYRIRVGMAGTRPAWSPWRKLDVGE